MGISDLFSKREARRKRGNVEDVYQYDVLSEKFRAQVIHIWRDGLGIWKHEVGWWPNKLWKMVFNVLVRERGEFALSQNGANVYEQCNYFMMETDTLGALDLIEVVFRFIHFVIRDKNEYDRKRFFLADPDTVIDELNGRFRENGIGYEFAGGNIIRVDSKFIHAEAVLPALELLHGAGKRFSGPLQEFMKGHEEYRKDDFKGAIVECLKAFESTLKAICTARGWPFDGHKDTAVALLKIVFEKKLVPDWMQSEFGGLRSVLEAGVPTVRNKTSGHGQGAVPVQIPRHLASFVLNLTASNIVFLIECHKGLS
jgi:AbiJ N-terminal domain 4